MLERKAVTKEMVQRYQRASKTQRGVMLDELCALTGWNRDYARRAIRLAAQKRRPTPPRKPAVRTATYDEQVLEPLRFIWATLNGPCGKRMAPFIGEMIEVLERCEELTLDSLIKDKLLLVSPATIDRKLSLDKAKLKFKGRSGTKPGTLLKGQIPIRTFSEWDETVPGFVECDLVAHDGGDPRGEFCQTLDLVDVASGWTAMQAVRNKAQPWVFEALTDIAADLPFSLLGIDSDNGSEFINGHLMAYCADNQITFTRSRPYRKNDSCFIEQKNWTAVRQMVGYPRYDTDAELAVLNELYSYLRLYLNFFQPQMRLKDKTREGAKVKKRYDEPRTPYQRLMQSGIAPKAKKALTKTYLTLNPVELKREIARCQDKLIKLAGKKQKVALRTPGPQPFSRRSR